MKQFIKHIKDLEREPVIVAVVTFISIIFIITALSFYFKSYQEPYMMKDIVDLSENWLYQSGQSGVKTLKNLRFGPSLGEDEKITLYKTLDIEKQDAAIMIRDNHQHINVYLDNVTLHTDGMYKPGANPGMELHFIPLPANYLNKTLIIEITSPFALYAGRTSPILMGDIPSLEAYAIHRSMRAVIFMSMCLLLGVCTVIVTFAQALNGIARPQNLALGIFAVIWGLYYVCTEYIAFIFFSPTQMSLFSLGFYFSFQVPLSLFLYLSFDKYRRWMLPAVVLPSVFVFAAFALQLFGVVLLPQLVNVNNILLTGLAYSIVLSIIEAVKGNRFIALVVPFLIISFISMLYNFTVFYTRQGVVPYSYRDTFFLMIAVVLIYNIRQFFGEYYRKVKEGELLLLQNRLARESYDNIKAHLNQTGGLKHEMKNHFIALRTYLVDERYEEAQNYLEKYSEKAEIVTDASFHENFLINAVVGNLAHIAKEHNIKVELNIKGNPINIADPDLYSLMTNIIENALEACAAVPNGKEKYLRLTVSRREPYLNIACENSKTGKTIESDGVIQTSKPGYGHGYGLNIIERIVEAYGGIMDVSYNETTFSLTAALKDK